MRMLIVSPEYPVETGVGGIGTYVYNFSKALVEKGIKVTVLSISLKQSSTYVENGVKVIRLKTKQNPIFRYIEITKWLVVNYKKYDLIEDEIYGGYSAFARIILGRKFSYIAKLHGSSLEVMKLEENFQILKKIKTLLTNQLEKYTAKNCIKLIVNSNLMRNFAFFTWGIDFSNQQIIPYVYENSQETISEENDVIKLPEKYFLYFGRIQKKKGSKVLERLIPKVLKRNPGYLFLLVGRDCENLKSKLRANSKIVFIENISSKNEIRRIIRNSKVVILPSLFESFLFTAVESIFEDIPILISRNCGVTEYMIETRTKFVVNNFAYEKEYLDRLQEIMDDYSSAKEDIQIQHEYLRISLNKDKIIGQYLDIIDKINEKKYI